MIEQFLYDSLQVFRKTRLVLFECTLVKSSKFSKELFECTLKLELKILKLFII